MDGLMRFSVHFFVLSFGAQFTEGILWHAEQCRSRALNFPCVALDGHWSLDGGWLSKDCRHLGFRAKAGTFRRTLKTALNVPRSRPTLQLLRALDHLGGGLAIGPARAGLNAGRVRGPRNLFGPTLRLPAAAVAR